MADELDTGTVQELAGRTVPREGVRVVGLLSDGSCGEATEQAFVTCHCASTL